MRKTDDVTVTISRVAREQLHALAADEGKSLRGWLEYNVGDLYRQMVEDRVYDDAPGGVAAAPAPVAAPAPAAPPSAYCPCGGRGVARAPFGRKSWKHAQGCEWHDKDKE